jgi:Cdc6-like AAA superfamily ATPase
MEIHPDSLNRLSNQCQRIIDVFREAWCGRSGAELLSWEIGQTAADLLIAWGLPESCASAALLMPILICHLRDQEELERDYGSAAVLAQRAVAWQAYYRVGESDKSDSSYSHEFRQLLRQVHIDNPNFQFVLLMFAVHDATYKLNSSYSLALQSESVYIPLANVLMTWDLHQDWQEKSTELLIANDSDRQQRYEQICADAKEVSWTRPEEQEEIILKCSGLIEKGEKKIRETDELDWYRKHKKLVTKAYAYQSIKLALMHQFGDRQIDPLPDIAIRFLDPGDLFQRERRRSSGKESDATKEILSQIWLTVRCKNEQDCYRALGAIHSLGKPVGSGFSEHFDDNIVALQPNGYRGLRTSIVYSFSRTVLGQNQLSQVLVEFRILTERMQNLNKWGVIEAFYKSPNDYTKDDTYKSVWWHPTKIEHLKMQLRDRTIPPRYPSIDHYINHYQLDTLPKEPDNQIYVFTPMGEIVLMRNGSLPRDFAYLIHSDLGNQAAKIKVNGQQADYHQPLRNGDIVEVTSATDLIGPDISWLGLVTTPKARRIIIKRLMSQLNPESPGQEAIWKESVEAMKIYRDIKRYDLRITSSKLEAYLEQCVTRYSLPNIDALYESVRRKENDSEHPGILRAHTIVKQLIAKELAGALRDKGGKSLSNSFQRITFCEFCRAVPGDAIVGYEYERTETSHVTIHLQGNKCPHGTHEVQVDWVNGSAAGPVVEFQILAEDRFHLLSDILKCAYSDSNCAVIQVDARAKQDGSAAVSMMVSGPDMQDFVKIREKIEKIRGLRQLRLTPVSPHELVKPAPPEIRYLPYRQTDAYYRREFYGREKQVDEILLWMQNEAVDPWLILRGQRRIGKTCFAKHLTYSVLPENGMAFPAYVDLQVLEDVDIQSIAKLILKELFGRLHHEVPIRLDGESSLEWLERGLEKGHELRTGQPLLIILDEVDYLIAHEHPIPSPIVFHNLLYIMGHIPSVRWLLVVSDTVYHTPSIWGEAGAIFSKANTLLVPALDPNYAIRLIREPAELNGFKFPDSDRPDRYENPCTLIALIRDEAGDNPYYLKRICYHMVERAQHQNRRSISRADLDYSILDVLMNGQSYFEHFLKYLTPENTSILTIAADRCSVHHFTTLDDVLDGCRQALPKMDDARIRAILEELERSGIIRISDDQYFHFSVPIFSRYVNQYLSPKEPMVHVRLKRRINERTSPAT